MYVGSSCFPGGWGNQEWYSLQRRMEGCGGHLRIGFPEPCLSQQLNGDAQVAQPHQTFNLNAVPRYVDRVTELLQQKLKQSQLLALKKELMVQKQQGALQEQAALEPKLDLLLEKTKELQKLVRRERETCQGGYGP